MIHAHPDRRRHARGRGRRRLACSEASRLERLVAAELAARAAGQVVAPVACRVARWAAGRVAEIVAVSVTASRLAGSGPLEATRTGSARWQESERRGGRKICGAQPRGYQNQPMREIRSRISDDTYLNSNGHLGTLLQGINVGQPVSLAFVRMSA